MIVLMSLLGVAFAAPQGWTVVGVTDGVEVSQRSNQGSELLAFRGEKITDVHASKLSSLLQDDPKATQWVDLMSQCDGLAQEDAFNKYLYQVYDLPWPVQDRDYVLKRTASYDDAKKLLTVRIVSTVRDDLKPVDECCVRADINETLWYIQSLEQGKTRVSVEVTTDPKGSLPVWVVNMLQKDWPHKTVNGLIARSRQADIAPDPMNASW